MKLVTEHFQAAEISIQLVSNEKDSQQQSVAIRKPRMGFIAAVVIS